MGWDGDISRMGELQDRLSDLMDIPSRVARRVAAKLSELVQEQFEDGKDPYNKPWKPLAQATLDKGRTPPPLTDTSAMRDSLRVRPLAHAGVGITIDPPAPPHQTGWSGPRGSGPARPILPDRSALPPAWNDAIEEAIDEELSK